MSVPKRITSLSNLLLFLGVVLLLTGLTLWRVAPTVCIPADVPYVIPAVILATVALMLGAVARASVIRDRATIYSVLLLGYSSAFYLQAR